MTTKKKPQPTAKFMRLLNKYNFRTFEPFVYVGYLIEESPGITDEEILYLCREAARFTTDVHESEGKIGPKAKLIKLHKKRPLTQK